MANKRHWNKTFHLLSSTIMMGSYSDFDEFGEIIDDNDIVNAIHRAKNFWKNNWDRKHTVIVYDSHKKRNVCVICADPLIIRFFDRLGERIIELRTWLLDWRYDLIKTQRLERFYTWRKSIEESCHYWCGRNWVKALFGTGLFVTALHWLFW